MRILLPKILISIILLLLISNCKVNKQLSIYDGSRADGTLTMFFEYGGFERPVVNWERARKEARLKCKNWGYNDAEFFGSGIQECIYYDRNGNCAQFRVYFKCQCTD